MLPSALLPQRGVIWSVAGPDAPVATVTIEGATVVLHLHVSRDGGLGKITVERWGNQGTEDARWRMIPFAGTCAGECGLGGYRIPARCAAGWWPETEQYFEFFEAEIISAVYR